MKSWNRFLYQYQQDVKLWLFCFFSLSIYRAAFILYFRNKIDASTPLTDILRVFLDGARYDSMAATAWALIPFLMSVANGFRDLEQGTVRFRRAWGEIFSVIFAGTCVVTVNYFREFNDQYNHFVVNLFYDDTRAILRTIWSDYHVVANFMVIGLLTALFVTILRCLWNRDVITRETLEKHPVNAAGRVLISLVIAALIVSGARGSLGLRTAQREQVLIIHDEFLNKAVLNPFLSFFYLVRDFATVEDDETGLASFLPDRNIKRAAQAVFSNRADHDDLDEYLKKTAPGSGEPRARHVFLVVMESYDSWPLMDTYGYLHLADELKQLAREGIFIRQFLPSGETTIQSLSSLITGLPSTTVDMQVSVKRYPSSLAAIFKRLGYTTNLFYGGKDYWQNIRSFARAQGFDEIYGADDMPGTDLANVWGIPDEDLFGFVLDTVDASRPSFNLIMTTSYHPPYSIDVYKKGFPLMAVPAELSREFDRSATLKELGHLWYSDHCLGSFVKKAEQRFPVPLFAVTGDHSSRRFINSRPGFYERSAVPFVLYGKDTLKGIHIPTDVAGSHIDIAPTLVELAAPRGFLYHSAGTSLLTAGRDHVGIGRNKVIGPDYLVDLAGQGRVHRIPDRRLPDTLPDISEMRTLLNQMNAISWWRVKRGPRL